MNNSLELTHFEKEIIDLYKDFTKIYYDPEIKKKHTNWSKDGILEKTWIEIYKKTPIETHIQKLLFQSDFDESTVMTEMENYINQSLHK